MRYTVQVLLGFLLLHPSFCLRATAQSCSLGWSTIDGGGGASTGGVYAVTGTIGQPDADATSGGNFTLQGGFWGVIAAVQTPGALLLSIFRTTTNTVAVTWPSPSTGWTLQQNTNSVSLLNWSNLTSGITDDGTTKTFIVNPPTGTGFIGSFAHNQFALDPVALRERVPGTCRWIDCSPVSG